MKTLGELSPREIEHDNPEIRRTDEMAHFLGQLYNRDVGRGRRRHRDPLLPDPERARRADVSRRERALLAAASWLRRIFEPKSSSGRSASPHSSQSTAAIDENGAPHDLHRRSSSPPHCGHVVRQLGLELLEPAAAPRRSRGRRRPSRRAPCDAPRAASPTPSPRLTLAVVVARGRGLRRLRATTRSRGARVVEFTLHTQARAAQPPRESARLAVGRGTLRCSHGYHAGCDRARTRAIRSAPRRSRMRAGPA